MELKELESGRTLNELFAGEIYVTDDNFYSFMIGIEYLILKGMVTEKDFNYYKENFLYFLLEEKNMLINFGRYDD